MATGNNGNRNGARKEKLYKTERAMHLIDALA